MWPSVGWSQTCAYYAGFDPYFSWHNRGGLHFDDTLGFDYVRPRTFDVQGTCNTCSYFAVTQAAEIAYRRYYWAPSHFTGHDQEPVPTAVRINFSEEGLRSWYSMLQGQEPSCEQGPSSPVGLLEWMVLDEARMVPQWRAPNRTSQVPKTSFVQLQPDYDADYVIEWQQNWYNVAVPWATLVDHERISMYSNPPLNEQMVREALMCGKPTQGFYDGPVIGSICVKADGTYDSPVIHECDAGQESHSVVIIGWAESSTVTQAIFIDNKYGELQMAPMSWFVNHVNGIQLMTFDFNWSHFPHRSLDSDGDGVYDTGDNCPAIYNPGQEDSDGDQIGDPCDQDRDGDGLPNGADADPDVSYFSTDLNLNGLYETSVPVVAGMQVGHRYTHDGCAAECALEYSGAEYQNCIAQCDNFATALPLPSFGVRACNHRNLYHPRCLQDVKNTWTPSGMTVAQFLLGYHPCALVHQARLHSFQEIRSRISAGELATYGWSNLTAFNAWIAGRASDCVTYMNPEDWTAERTISVENHTLDGTGSCGPTCRKRLVCPDAAFRVNYTKDVLAPSGAPGQGLYWIQVPDDKVMIGGCPCQGGYYPLYCSNRCEAREEGMEHKSISAISGGFSNSWDPLLGGCPSPLTDENILTLPPHSSFCTSRLVTDTQNQLIQEKAEFYDYDLWIKNTGGDVSRLGDYHELDVTKNGRFRARYSKHPAFSQGVPREVNGTEMHLGVFSNTVDFPAGLGCYAVGAYIYNWISNGLRIIPGIAERGPAWGVSKVGDEGQLVLGMDATGLHAQRSGIVPDNVLNLRVLSGADPEATTFLAAMGTNGALTSFRKYQYQNQAILDKGLISVSKVPALTEVIMVPLDETRTLVAGKATATTWGLYTLTVDGDTGTLQSVARLFNTPTLAALWENSKDPAVTIISNTSGKLRRYKTDGSTLTLVYELGVDLPVRSAARTDLGLAAVLGSSVFLLDEAKPNLEELTPEGLPGDLDAFTVVPRTGLRVWGRGGKGERDGYQYYPQMKRWERFTCLKNMD